MPLAPPPEGAAAPPPGDATGAGPAPRLDELLDTAPCGFLSFGDDGRITLANATLAALLGYERGELEGRHVETLLTLPGRIFYQTHLFPLIKLHGIAQEIFLILRAKGGAEVGVLLNAVRRERAGASAIDCALIEVRERRKYEDELLRARRAADEARAAAEARRRELEDANRQLEEQALELELQHQQLQEQSNELETHREELQSINEHLTEQAEELERERTAADEARRAAEEANRAKSTFLAVMSHELRTPLNAISGYVQLIEMGIHGPVTDAQRDALERVTRSQRHLLRLINDILNLARIESGRAEYRIEDVELAELLEGVAPMIEPQLGAKGLAYTARVAPGLVVRADREKLQQVVINLLGNAVKFTPPGGAVTVDAPERPATSDRIFLRVSDTGIGIPADKLANLFQPFVQVDVSRTRRNEGTGLGLAISRDLARGMGGDLRVRSVEGRGSTFTVTMPRAT